MNIYNFEQETDPKILSRGKDYFAGGAVINLEEPEPLCYDAVVEGTEDYAVRVSLAEDGNITKLSCDCPYDLGEVCKHKIAVLLAIRNKMKKPATKNLRKSKNEKETLKELLEAQTKETLSGLLFSMAEDDRALRKALLLRFSTGDGEYELSRRLIREHIRRHTRRGYIEWNETDAALTGAWEVLERAEKAAQSDCIRAVKLCFVVLPEAFSLLNICDDSGGKVGAVISHCVGTVMPAALSAQNSLPKYSRDELFDLILDQAENDIYKGWSDLRISFWECLTVFCGDPALYQRLWDRLEEERHGFIERDGYYEESLARLQLHLLTEWDGEEKGLEFLLAHLRYHSFRRQAINEAMKRSDYEAALRYAEDGLAQDAEKGSPGYVHEWRVASYEAYKALCNMEKVRELAEYFVKHERDGMKYYDVLKNTTPPEEWPEALGDLLAFFEADRFPSSTYSKILIVEKDFERLMSICRRNNSRISELGAIFPESYLCEVEQIYRAYILARSESASDRRMYKEACELLKGFGDVCGKAVMNELAQKIRAEHPRRPAFLDELGKLG